MFGWLATGERVAWSILATIACEHLLRAYRTIGAWEGVFVAGRERVPDESVRFESQPHPGAKHDRSNKQKLHDKLL